MPFDDLRRFEEDEDFRVLRLRECAYFARGLRANVFVVSE
jgi:hypothetical protein